MDANTALRNMNRSLAMAITTVLDGRIDDHLAFVAPTLDLRPFGEVVVHAYRPVLAATCIVAGRTWPARQPQPTTIPALQDLVGVMVTQVDDLLADLSDEALVAPVLLRWGRHPSGLDAINGSLAHGFVHVGVLRGISAMGGFPTRAEE